MPTQITLAGVLVWFVFFLVAGSGWTLGSAIVSRVLR